MSNSALVRADGVIGSTSRSETSTSVSSLPCLTVIGSPRSWVTTAHRGEVKVSLQHLRKSQPMNSVRRAATG